MDVTTTRRAFLQTGGALVIGFTMPLSGRAAAARSTTMSAYLRIDSDERITVICGSSEMGQGVLTSIPMLLAEELDADWSKVGVEQAPVDKAYANPLFGMQATGSSTTIRAHWLPMRQAGAAAREMLMAAAAAQWNADPGQLATAKGFVTGPGGKKASYGSLAEAASKLPVPAKPTLKDPAKFKILGRPTRRLDTRYPACWSR